MYFSTAPDKKQAFSLYFFNEIRLLTFCPVFSFESGKYDV